MSKKKKKNKYKNKWYAHEALDRIHVIRCNIEDHIQLHPYIENTKTLATDLDEVQLILGRVYQSIGLARFIREEKKKKKKKKKKNKGKK